MATTVTSSNLDTWLSEQAENTVDTPYEIIITLASISSSVVLDALQNNLTKYVSIVELQGNGLVRAFTPDFNGCTNLVSINIPDTTTKISGNFSGCTNLKSVTIPDSVTEIDSSSFEDCTSLASITIPSSVTTIGDSAFYNSGLASITIPNSVTEIDNMAFAMCSGLTLITIPDSVTSIGSNIFYNSTNLTIAYLYPIPSTITTYTNAFRYSSLSKIIVPKANLSAWQAITASDWGLSSTDVFVAIPDTKRWMRIA